MYYYETPQQGNPIEEELDFMHELLRLSIPIQHIMGYIQYKITQLRPHETTELPY